MQNHKSACILKTSDQTPKTGMVPWTGLLVNVLHSWDHPHRAWKHPVSDLMHPNAAAIVLQSIVSLINEMRRVKKNKAEDIKLTL